MLLFVGLGNPSPDNENNRHNIGFKIIDAINQKYSLSKQKPKFKGLLTTGSISNKKVYAIKPLTFMNNSGICIRELMEYFKIDAEDVIVFHDDLDIDFGKVKAKFGGSDAGHNGIASIDKFIGKEYSRVRIGIGKPKNNIAVNVWERGAGLTKACGTAACATAVAAFVNKLTNNDVNIKFKEGILKIKYDENNNIFMTGPVSKIENIKIDI